MGEILKANKDFNRKKFSENFDKIQWDSSPGDGSEKKRREVLKKLTQESQELGLYDDPPEESND